MEVNVGGIKCDNPKCDYKEPNIPNNDYDAWLDVPCPKCGSNLLTKEDLNMLKLLLNAANGLKTLIDQLESKECKDSSKVCIRLGTHKGISIESMAIIPTYT